MLSLMEYVRVFESSDDIRLHTAFDCLEKTKPNNAIQRNKRIDKDTKIDENELLNLQHFCVLQHDNNAVFHFERETDVCSIDQELLAGKKHERRLMELVFLASGEIRTRNDGPRSCNRPRFQLKNKLESGNRCKTRRGYRSEEDLDEKDDEMEEDKETDRRHPSYKKRVEGRQTKILRQSRQQQDDGQQKKGFDLVSLSSLSADGVDLSNDDDRLDESKRSEESEKQEKDPFVSKEEQTRQGVQNADGQVWFQKHSVAKVARDDVNRTPTHSRTMDHLGREQATDKTHAVRHTTDFCKEKEAPSSGDTSHGARQRPAPMRQVEQVLGLDRSNDVFTRQSKRSPKMEVSHLASDEPISSPMILDSTRKESSMEKELQKEKWRVQEKTTRLLDEQNKNQQLRDRVGVFEARFAAQDSEISSEIRRAARGHDKQRRKLEEEQNDCVSKLKAQICFQEANIARLEHDKIQLQTALKQLKKTESELSSNQHYDTIEVVGLRAELDYMNRRLYEFLAKVERWKSNSKKKMQNHDKKTDLPDFLENLWLAFPQFSGVVPRPRSERPSRSSEPQQQPIVNVDEQADMVFFLKKKLREREDKLRQAHIKYMELKEMCARQCVREADLQNFVNEHRLRGNLIIRKNSSSKSKGADSNQEQVQKDQHDENRRNSTLKMTPSRDNNIPASYNERGRAKKDVLNEECSDKCKDNDDCENGNENGNSLRTPNVFAQVGRDRACEHASTTNSAVPQKRTADQSRGKRRMQPKQQQQRELVERIRSISSPSLAQQYDRVVQGKKSVQQPLIQTRLGACPPRCGSRPSFMRRQAPTSAAQAKRPVTTGVNRPWI